MARRKQADKQAGKQATASPPPTLPPSWPALSPLVPASHLAVHERWPDHILTIPRLWTARLCSAYVSFLSSLPLVTTSGRPAKGEAGRVNDRLQLHDPVFAQRLWSETALSSLIGGREGASWGGEVVGLNPNIRIYRYSAGHFFQQHCTSLPAPAPPPSPSPPCPATNQRAADDDENLVTIPASPPVPARTTWTLLLYLTSPATGCLGGETVFYPHPQPKKAKHASPPPVVVEPEVGMALLHRHGAECMLHEGREVLRGEKWLIRTDLCVRR